MRPEGRSVLGQRGFTTGSVLVLLSVAMGLVLAVSHSATQQVRLAGMNRDKQAALTLAEAGIEEALESFRADRSFRGKTEELYTDSPANTRPFGTYETTVQPIEKNRYKVVSTGTNPSGVKRGVVAIVEIPANPLGGAAIQASGEVRVNGVAEISTEPGNLHNADIYSNGAIALSSSSQIDGTLYAADTVSAPDYDSGRVYSPSVTGATPWIFPTDTEVAEMKATLIAEARATQHTLSSIHDSITIATPAYIAGDLVLDKDDTVTLSGNGVVYVSGDVRLEGKSTLVNEGTLVVGGTFRQSGNATYKVTPGVLPTPTVAVFNESNYVPAMTLNGSPDSLPQGILYAVHGGIQRTGNTDFAGALVAGGENGTVTAEGNYRQHFPEKLRSHIAFPGTPRIAFWGETDGQ